MIWDPVELLGRMAGPLGVLVSMLALAIATLTTNLAANVVSPANDFSNLAPRLISFRPAASSRRVDRRSHHAVEAARVVARATSSRGSWATRRCSARSAAILIADYFVLRRTQLVVDDLYRRGGATSTLVASICPRSSRCARRGAERPGLPGAGVPGAIRRGAGVLAGLYSYAWFLGFGLAAIVYLLLMRGRRD